MIQNSVGSIANTVVAGIVAWLGGSTTPTLQHSVMALRTQVWCRMDLSNCPSLQPYLLYDHEQVSEPL